MVRARSMHDGYSFKLSSVSPTAIYQGLLLTCPLFASPLSTVAASFCFARFGNSDCSFINKFYSISNLDNLFEVAFCSESTGNF